MRSSKKYELEKIYEIKYVKSAKITWEVQTKPFFARFYIKGEIGEKLNGPDSWNKLKIYVKFYVFEKILFRVSNKNTVVLDLLRYIELNILF